jgi:streptogramin lyase
MRAMHRLSFLVALLAMGCSSHSVAPEPAPISPQVFQKQPFNNPWLKTNLGLRGVAPTALVAQGKYVWVADGIGDISRVSMRQGSKNFRLSITTAAIIFGSDKNFWIASGYATIARMTPIGLETDFPLPDSSSHVSDLTVGADGALWFAVATDSQDGIGRMDTNGAYKFYPVGYTWSPCAGPDGNLWYFDNTNLNAMNTQGQIVGTYPSTVYSQYCTIGPDGAMWFTTYGTTLVRVTTTGQITSFTAPSILNDITSANGLLWMTSGSALLPFNPNTSSFGAAISSPYNLKRISTGVDGNFWMTGPDNNIVTYVNQVMSVSPTSLTLQLGQKNAKSGTRTVSETNYSGTWSAMWPSSLVNVVQNSPGVFTVTAVGQGTGKITIQDTMHNYTKIPVTVR